MTKTCICFLRINNRPYFIKPPPFFLNWQILLEFRWLVLSQWICFCLYVPEKSKIALPNMAATSQRVAELHLSKIK